MKEIEDITGAGTTPEPAHATYVRCAAYAHSTTSVGDQLETVLETARRYGLDVAQDDCIAEHGSGANIVGRPGLQRILEMAERGEISHLVHRDWSRLSRNYRDLRHILATLAEADVTVVTEAGENLSYVEHSVATEMQAARR